MRVSTAALCTLALLACDDWTGGAIAASPNGPPPASTDQSQAEAEPDSSVATRPTPEIAVPESNPGLTSVSKMTVLAGAVPQDAPVTAPEAAVANLPLSVSPLPQPAISQVPDEPVEASIAPPSTGIEIPASPGAIAPPETLQRAIAQLPATDANLLIEQDGVAIPITAAEKNEVPSSQEIEELQERLRNLDSPPPDFGDVFEGSPAITISNPSGYGADGGTGFVGFGFQTSVRDSDEADAGMTFGVGLGDADDGVGVQLSYTLASFGANREFGSGGFNAKFHRRLAPGWSLAAGWEGFLTVGDPVDFEDTLYTAVTYVAETAPDINDPFSRIALTAGVGNGRFRTEEAIQDGDDTFGVFGSMAVRIARPVSAMVEWTGQDLALGLSIAPFRDFPLVLTPALRDVAGAGDGARLVLGAGVSFRF